jgi:predicted Zn-dependent protease with MMP-like domain
MLKQSKSPREGEMSIDAIYDLTAPTLDDFEEIANDIYDRLPTAFRKRCGQLLFRIEDLPDDDIAAELELESPFEILGLFQGVDLGQASSDDDASGEPNVIFLYRRAIIDEWADSEIALGDIIAHVIIHEIGHHFGLSDEDMERIEAEVADEED